MAIQKYHDEKKDSSHIEICDFSFGNVSNTPLMPDREQISESYFFLW